MKQKPYIHRLEISPQSEVTLIELIYKDANTVCSGSSHRDEVVTSQTHVCEGLQRAEDRTPWNAMARQLVGQLSIKVGLVYITWMQKCMLCLQGMYEAHS